MKMKYFMLIYIFLNYLVLAQSFAEPIRDDYTKAQVHGLDQDCEICHLSHKMTGIELLKEPLSELCLVCHPDNKAPTEHIVDIIPSMEVLGLPLTGGKMTCITCHDSHKNTYKNMLRVDSKNLCQICHNY